jgi:hypothetical protein
MPERIPPAQQLANLKKLQSEFEVAYAKGLKTGDPARAEELKSYIETGATALRESLDSRPNAERILGLDFLGPKDVEAVFGTRPTARMTFSTPDLERAKELGQQYIDYVDTMNVPDPESGEMQMGVPVTMENLKKYFPKAHDNNPMLYSQDWYNNEAFFKNERPRVGGRLTSKEVVPNSASKNYLQQTDLLITHLQDEVFKGGALPKEYADAIAEYKAKKPGIETLMTANKWQDASKILSELAITKLTRETPVEALYRLILNNKARQQKPLPSIYSWTSGRDSEGHLVYVGDFDEGGADVYRYDPTITNGALGACFSRM